MDIKKQAQDLKIATEFSDACIGETKEISNDVLEFFIKRIKDEKKLRWQSNLDSIYVCQKDNIIIDVVSKNSDIKIIDHKFENLGIIEENGSNKKYQIKILDDLNIGYHTLKVEIAGKICLSALAIAPQKCYNKQEIENKKLWGFAIQLYALRSKQNWGVGDFSDLKKLVEISAKKGCDLIGINPINILNHNYPEDASPYSGNSRLYINPIYIDVEKTKGFKKSYTKGLNISELRKLDIIDYSSVYNTKIKVLEKIYQTSVLPNEFIQYCSKQGSDLEDLATYQALAEVYGCNYRTWQDPYHNPYSKETIAFKKENQERIGFFKFLQYEADRQFREVSDAIAEAKMSIGLYRDLPVGVGQCSAEFWSNKGSFIADAGAGAPPDMFNPKGQAWGLGAFDPYNLKQNRYQHLISVLRANMAYAGALRLDHVMWLMRLFVIPNSKEEGTYIYYNFEEMLNILAIESHINKCMIVGESIGNVPDGFLDMLKERNIAPISVLWAEKYDCGWGEFKSPHDYPKDAFVSISTHDMPPLKKWWFAYDVALQRRVGLIEDDEKLKNCYFGREEDRRKLLRVLDNNGLWPQDNPRFRDCIYGEDYPEGIEEAAHNLLIKSNAKCALLCLEDIFQVQKQQNLPGTDRDKYPNWRRKLPIDIEDFESNEMFARNMNLLKDGR